MSKNPNTMHLLDFIIRGGGRTSYSGLRAAVPLEELELQLCLDELRDARQIIWQDGWIILNKPPQWMERLGVITQ